MSSEAEEQTGASGHILVVDSEVLVRHAIADYLRHCGYTVIEAASTDEAIVVLGEADLQIDAVLCDARATGSFNGFGLAQWARDNRPTSEVILSGSIAAATDAAAELCESGPQLARPYEPSTVLDYIKRLMATRLQQNS